MTTEHLTALAASADRLAQVRPDGRLELDPDLVAVLVERVDAAGADDAGVATALEEGEAYTAAIDAGCPPQFHPGVPAEQATILEAVRTRLGLDRASEITVNGDPDPRHVRVLRAVGCPLAPAGG